MAAIQYREAGAADIPGMARIRALEWENDAYWKARMTGYMNGSISPQRALASRVVFVAVDDANVVGFIAGHLTQRFGCEGELEWVNILPERRRNGIASELVRRLAAWFVTRKAARVCVNVSPGNAEARAFYHRHGAEFLSEYWLAWENVSVVLKPAQRD